MKTLVFFAVLLALYACQNTPELVYPETRKDNVVDTYFGDNVPDPYRWLEDDMSDETADWVAQQNKLAFGYLDKIPFRDELRKRLEKIWNYEKISAPFQEGEYTYFYKNSGLQNHYVLYRQKGDYAPEVFLDPNNFSEDGTTSLAGVSFSKDGKKLAYSISEGGSDWRKIITIDTDTKTQIGDTLVDIKFSGVSWKANEGFFYASYDKPDGSELSAKTDQHKLYYHKLGTPQSEDILVFGGEEKYRYVGGSVTEDNRYLIISASKSTSGNMLFIKDLIQADKPLVTVLDSFESDTYLIDNEGSTLYFVTNLNAPNKKIVRVDANNPQPSNWADVIPEADHVLSPSKGAGYFFAEYMIDAISKVYQYDYQGNAIREVALPGLGSAGSFGGKKEQKTLYFSFSNYYTPNSYFSYDPKTGETTPYWTPEIAFSAEDYESKQVFYTSKDGTKVPMIITYKKGTVLNGKNPTILYGYGGFNISLTPSFSVVNATWMALGGVYAVPNLRGGGEYGKEWHIAGTQLQKQNVFDDFIAAAEFLIDEGYTSPEYLAIRGGSNGGLLVGATMTQRPDLAKVALPAVGVLDMLRYHTFTAGAGWAYDYGTADQSEEMFQYLKGYSPLHNIDAGTLYPATLVTTGDHDDRVVPAHSFKFAATLQENQQGANPVLIRVETDAGHGAGTPTSKSIALYADIFGFTLYNMGIKSLP
jgi:prolyl oligopeptidase